jgi:hypothetical protein
VQPYRDAQAVERSLQGERVGREHLPALDARRVRASALAESGHEPVLKGS